MNKHILLVMKFQNDRDSVDLEELVGNARSAFVAADKVRADHLDSILNSTPDVTTYVADSDAADSAHLAADSAIYVAYLDADANNDYYTDRANFWIDKYFEYSGENKQDYLDFLSNEG
jgi:hypothetical protein